MAASAPPLVFWRDFDPQTGTPVPVAKGLMRITAPNSGPYTFTGTNSFIVGDGPVAILDPGPDDDGHFKALLDAVDGREIAAIVLTHTHRDHCAIVPRLRAATGAPVWFAGQHRPSRRPMGLERRVFARSPASQLAPDRVIRDGDRLFFGSTTLEAIATPGHCANHTAFAVEGAGAVLTGDHLMGWSSTIVASPDGNLADYLASIDKLLARRETLYIPAHGGEITNGPEFARAIKTHRLMRNGQILQALASGSKSLSRLTRMIYPQLSGRLRMGARQTLLAHAEYLAEKGQIVLDRTIFGVKLALPSSTPR